MTSEITCYVIFYLEVSYENCNYWCNRYGWNSTLQRKYITWTRGYSNCCFDVIVNAFATTPDKAYLHLDLAAKLVSFFRETTKPRLFFILGAASLLDESDKLFLETLKTLPDVASWISIPTEAYKTLNFLRGIENVNWVGVSPSADFIAGEATVPVVGKDHLLISSNGKSVVTSGTMAVAILNEIEKPQFINTRFTVGNQ
ncbi:MAG: putative NADH-flavin reductase [Herbinix sp.]|nr:putative NADH-flavin reductase [Herbinix sp.]